MDKIIEALEKRIESIEADIREALKGDWATKEDLYIMQGEIDGLNQAIRIVKEKGAE